MATVLEVPKSMARARMEAPYWVPTTGPPSGRGTTMAGAQWNGPDTTAYDEPTRIRDNSI
ncbi:hypothetical protein Lfu02_07530 [Longispora fulva]|nr:hypothetical protein Lfu02_07530 [Longispora fulva]